MLCTHESFTDSRCSQGSSSCSSKCHRNPSQTFMTMCQNRPKEHFQRRMLGRKHDSEFGCFLSHWLEIKKAALPVGQSRSVSACPPACPLLCTTRAHSMPYLAIQYHARRGAAPPACQYYHAGPCSWRYALALPALQHLLL